MKEALDNFLKNSAAQLKKNWWAFLIAVVLTGGAGWLLCIIPIGQKLVQLSYDLPFQHRHVIKPTEAVMIYMDESSYTDLKQSYIQPWDRSLHAKLIDRMTVEGARSVSFDIVFSDPGPNPQADQDFADAIKDNRRVILAADNIPADTGITGAKINQLVLPYEMFSTNAANIGTAEMFSDPDLMNRQHLPEKLDEQVFCLSWATAEVAGARVATNSSVHAAERWYNYYGPTKTIPSYSYYQLFTGEIPAGTFSNKMVFVGANIFTRNAWDRKDAYPSPFPVGDKDSKFMPGVEIQATGALNLLREDWLRRLPRPTERVIIVGLGACLAVVLLLCRPIFAVAIAAVLTFAVASIHFYFFAAHRYWFPWLIVEAQIPVALVWGVAFNAFQDYVQRRLFEQTLALHLSPKRVKQLVNRKELLAPGAEKQMLTVLFSDLENFTTLSEGVDSTDLAKLMNNYFETAVSRCVFKTDGFVVKYIGDAIFAFWNAPEEQKDHTARACEAALLLSQQAISFAKSETSMHCRTRVGLHTGVANVGNFGSATRIDYTAIGENINLASRMEGLNKYLGTSVLITGETFSGIDYRFVTRFCGKFRLKGFEKAVDVHELVGMADTAEPTKAWRQAFDEALKRFHKGNFDDAEAGFRCVLEIKPNDGPSRFYLNQIEDFRTNVPDADWEGEVELKDK